MNATDQQRCGHDADQVELWRDRGTLRSPSVKAIERLLEDCLADSQRVQVIEAAVPTMTREQLETQRWNYPSAAKRLDEMDAERRLQEEHRNAAERERVASDPAVRRAAASARVCGLELWRTEMLQKVRREQDYANEVGVVDLGKLQHFKSIIQGIDDSIGDQRKRFSAVSPPQCSNETVARIAGCLHLHITDADGRGWDRIPPAPEACTIAPELTPYLFILGERSDP